MSPSGSCVQSQNLKAGLLLARPCRDLSDAGDDHDYTPSLCTKLSERIGVGNAAVFWMLRRSQKAEERRRPHKWQGVGNPMNCG